MDLTFTNANNVTVGSNVQGMGNIKAKTFTSMGMGSKQHEGSMLMGNTMQP